MRILVTGNMGYVGPVVVAHLKAALPDADLIGFDAGFFAHNLTGPQFFPEAMLSEQHFGDTREMAPALLEGVDAVVHLAAVSNDPMGNRYEKVTKDINQDASVRLALQAKRAGVKSFVFASSCSVYGAADGPPRKESDALNPLTAYARSKIGTERGLRDADLGAMMVSCLRFATACGMSPRLRLDLVLNDFVACALATKDISVLSDGTPWRPLIDVRDMARAIVWAITRPAEAGGQFLSVNVGADPSNYQVAELANGVAKAVPGTVVSINTAAPPDKRSYRVDFSLFKALAPDHAPRMTLASSIDGLKTGLTEMGFADADFRNSQFMRLKTLERHIEQGRLQADLRWAKPHPALVQGA